MINAEKGKQCRDQKFLDLALPNWICQLKMFHTLLPEKQPGGGTPVLGLQSPHQRWATPTVAWRLHRCSLGRRTTGQRACIPRTPPGGRCKLVVMALKVGGRWSTEAASFIRQLAQTRCRAAPAALQTATAQAYIARWSALLTHAAQTAFAKSLLFEDLRLHTAGDGESPLLSDLLDLHTTPPDISPLPP